MTASRPITLRLRRGEAKRPVSGHPWIYRNEVDRIPEALVPGDLVEVLDHRGRYVGRGYANPASVILARLLTWQEETIDEQWLAARIRRALALRNTLRPDASACRLIFSEGDGLPGLIVDRYGPLLVVQALTAGIDRLLPLIVPILVDECRPSAILARHDLPSRAQEQLPLEKRWLYQSWEGPVSITFRGLELSIDCFSGQKTGLYLDQADNYALVDGLAPGGRVLDGCCYLGLWSLEAARSGATHVVGIDQSATAVSSAQHHATVNGLNGRCHFQVGNIFEELKRRSDQGELYDVVILDPPSFVKRRSRVDDAVRGYKEINLRAMKLIRPGGFLLTSSCSYHLRPPRFRTLLADAAADLNRPAKLLAWRGQAIDHPSVLIMEESDYLKCVLLQIA